MSEHRFPTIADLLKVATKMVEDGYGALPFQMIVAPDSTLQALARGAGATGDKPALMIEWDGEEGRMPVCLTSAERLTTLKNSGRSALQ